MNYHINGSISEKNPAYVVIDNNGIGYSLRISLATYDKLPENGASVLVYTYLSLKNEEFQLYGFLTLKERFLFMKLLDVPKVGPKTALSVFNALTPEEFENSVFLKNAGAIAKAKGISKKTAENIILELSGKLAVDSSHIANDAYEALLALGFIQKDIDAIMKDVMAIVSSPDDTEQIIKEALKRLR